MHRQTTAHDGIIVSSQKKMHLVPAPLKQSSVIQSESTGADYRNFHEVPFASLRIAIYYWCTMPNFRAVSKSVRAASYPFRSRMTGREKSPLTRHLSFR